jgi:hypothetical protein
MPEPPMTIPHWPSPLLASPLAASPLLRSPLLRSLLLRSLLLRSLLLRSLMQGPGSAVARRTSASTQAQSRPGRSRRMVSASHATASKDVAT